MKVNLLLAYEFGGRAVALGRIRDPQTVQNAARVALSEKRSEIAGLKKIDAGLAAIGSSELEKLERLVGQMIPGATGRRACKARPQGSN